MKRVLILILAMLMLALPVMAEPMTGLAFTTDVAEDGSLIFYFEDLTLRLPAEWQDKVVGLPSENGLGFYHRASYEKYLEEGIENGGFLFSLGASVDSSFSDLPAFEYLGFSDISYMNYYIVLPSDYPAYAADESIRAEYDAMYAQVGQVVDSVVIYSAEDAAPAPNDSAPATDAPATDAPADAAPATDGNRHL